MSIPLKLIEIIESANRGWVDRNTGEKPSPGDCFYAPWMLETESWSSWTRRSSRDWGKTSPRVIVLPTGQWWCIDQRAYKAPDKYDDSIPHKEWEAQGWHGEGWNVSGDLPNVSVTPSIQVDGYHGFVTNGELT